MASPAHHHNQQPQHHTTFNDHCVTLASLRMNRLPLKIVFCIDDFLNLKDAHKLIFCSKLYKNSLDLLYYINQALSPTKSNMLVYHQFIIVVAMALKRYIPHVYKYELSYNNHVLKKFNPETNTWKTVKQKELFNLIKEKLLSLRINNLKLTKLLPDCEVQKIALVMFPPSHY